MGLYKIASKIKLKKEASVITDLSSAGKSLRYLNTNVLMRRGGYALKELKSGQNRLKASPDLKDRLAKAAKIGKMKYEATQAFRSNNKRSLSSLREQKNQMKM
jgi:hypothetical protein